jgi:hypothetical protein
VSKYSIKIGMLIFVLSWGCQRSVNQTNDATAADAGTQTEASKGSAGEPSKINQSEDSETPTTAENTADADPTKINNTPGGSPDASRNQADPAGGKINSDRDDPNRIKGVDCIVDPTITQASIASWVTADKAKRGAASNFKYTHVPLDMLKNKDDANIARVAVFKALNHTAMDMKEIHVGEDVSEGHCAVYAFDTAALWGGRAASNWTAVTSAQGRQPFSPAPRQSLEAFDGNNSVAMDRLSYNVVQGNIYNELINTPRNEGGIRSRYNIQDTVLAWGAMKEAIVYGPRVFWLRQSATERLYWATGDRFDGQPNTEIPYSGNDTPRFKNGAGGSQVDAWGTHASEAWIEMDNGFIAYFVWGNATQERSKAEQSFVIDPGNPVTQDLITGRSCITCHLNGSQSAPSDLAGQGVWATNAQLGEFYNKTTVKFQAAMKTIVEAVSDGDDDYNNKITMGILGEEPIDAMVRRVEGIGRRKVGTNGLTIGSGN